MTFSFPLIEKLLDYWNFDGENYFCINFVLFWIWFFLFSLVFLAKVGPADDKALMADLMEGESKPHSGTSAHTDNDKEYKPKAKNLFEEQEAILENSVYLE